MDCVGTYDVLRGTTLLFKYGMDNRIIPVYQDEVTRPLKTQQTVRVQFVDPSTAPLVKFASCIAF